MHIVVIHTGAVGDLVQALPALAAVREAHPSAAVTFVGRPARGGLARAAGVCDACIDLETSGLWRALAGDPCGPCPAWLAEANLVLDFLTKGTFAARHGEGRRVITVDPLPPDDYGRPAAVYVAAQVRSALGLPPREDERPEMALDATARDAGREALAARGIEPPLVAIHPGSGSVRKNWPMERFEALARRLGEETDRAVAWLAGPAEIERGTVPGGGETVLADLSLVDVAAVCALADAYVGNDSGVTQIAAAVRVPRSSAAGAETRRAKTTGDVPSPAQPRGVTAVVALFGPTDACVWAPRGEHVHLVPSPDGTMEGIDLDVVWEAVRAAR
ncbi:MAG: glycosyltransferase family 9 protein [Phycisphaerae bacterium]